MLDQDYGQFIIIDDEPAFTKINTAKERIRSYTRKRTTSEETQERTKTLFDNLLKLFGVSDPHYH